MTMDSTATSSNYFQVALNDDHAVVDDPPVLDKASIRQQRIAAAVQRSKTEYKEENAYTERGSATASTQKDNFQRAKIDRQQLEFLVSSLYYNHPRQYGDILTLILEAIDPTKKSAGGLSRELLDTGLQAAVKCGGHENGVKLARLTQDLWRGQAAGLAVSASDAFAAGSLPKDAVVPLLASSSSYGLHDPVLSRLRDVLGAIAHDTSPELEKEVKLFQSAVSAVLKRRSRSRPPLFSDDSVNLQSLSLETDDDTTEAVSTQMIDTKLLASALHLKGKACSDLDMTLRRLDKTLKGDQEVEDAEGRVERGVREL